MPIQVFKFTTNFRWAIWQAEENIDELNSLLWIDKNLTIKKENRLIQQIASRLAAQFIIDNKNYQIVKNGKKPEIEPKLGDISLSHSGNCGAAIFSDKARVGIDIQLKTHNLALIRHKYLSLDELNLYTQFGDIFLHHAWGAKECIYKILNQKGIIYKTHLQIIKYDLDNLEMKIKVNYNNINTIFEIQHLTFDNYYITWIYEK